MGLIPIEFDEMGEADQDFLESHNDFIAIDGNIYPAYLKEGVDSISVVFGEDRSYSIFVTDELGSTSGYNAKEFEERYPDGAESLNAALRRDMMTETGLEFTGRGMDESGLGGRLQAVSEAKSIGAYRGLEPVEEMTAPKAPKFEDETYETEIQPLYYVPLLK